MLDALDVQEMKRIAEDSYEEAISRAYVGHGVRALTELLQFLIQLYAHLEPETITGTLFVVCRIRGETATDTRQFVKGGVEQVFRHINRLPTRVHRVTVVEVEGGVFRVWEGVDFDEVQASVTGLVYCYRARQEFFVVKGTQHMVRNPAPIHASVFSRPTFSSLRDALLDYSNRLIRTSACFIFREVWSDPGRLYFKPKPEWLMRRSLHQFLMITLRDTSVLAEQSVDESHPVDIRVAWTLTNREAIIEIKWLGKSRSGRRVTADHSEARAREGAEQLANYLIASHQSAPGRDIRGYLVVIDGRRGSPSSRDAAKSRARVMRYARREIEYDPEYHKIRVDFDVPIRMYAEPT